MSEEPLDRDEAKKVSNEEITTRFQRIGIWEQTPEQVEITRANFRLINEIREARERREGAIKRSVREMVTSAMGQGLWVMMFAAVVFIGRLLWGALQK